jgi:hypothetical protein
MADVQSERDDAPAGDESVIDLDASTPPARRPHRRPFPVLLAAGVTLVMLLGVGAFVAYQRLSAGKRPPEEFTPASVALFASLDLTVGGDQVARLAELMSRFDRAGAGRDGADVLRSLAARLSLEHVDVERDIASWLGARLGVSLWLDQRSRSYTLISAATTDDRRARAGLRRIRSAGGEIGFVVESGTALVVLGDRDAQAAAEAAAEQARTAPLSGLASYREGRRWLGDGHLLTLWGDAGRYAAMTQSWRGPRGAQSYGVTIPGSPSTAIAGVRASEDGFEARYRLFGPPPRRPRTTDAVARLADLPARTEYGAVRSVTRDAFTLGLPVGSFGGFVDLLLGNLTLGPVPLDPFWAEAPPRELTRAELDEVHRLVAKDPATLTDTESRRLTELIGFSPVDAVRPRSDDADTTVTLAVTGVADHPDLRLVAETASARAADDIAFALLARRAETVAVKGTVVTMTSPNYTAGAGRLGDVPAFARLLRGAPARTDTALYADLASAVAPGRFRTFKVGLALGVTDDGYTGVARLLVT